MINKTFKLQSIKTKYVTDVENKKVTATCWFYSILGCIKAVGYAVCGPDDKFNKAKGRKLARARAELNANAIYRNKLLKYQDMLNDKIDTTTEKLFNYIGHQIDYIEQLKNKE